jgi:hypothetical protein
MGCFYTDEINERPSVQIRNNSDAPNRGSMVHLESMASDPEGNNITYKWRAYGCSEIDDPNDPNLFERCGDWVSEDGKPAALKPTGTGVLDTFDFTVPFDFVAKGGTAKQPTQSVVVILEATDEQGAVARPSARIVMPVIDQPTSIDLAKSSVYRFVKGTPVDLFAKVSDDDDDPSATSFHVDWTPYGTNGQCVSDGTCSIVDGDPAFVVDPMNAANVEFHKILTPMTTGSYSVSVVATPPVGEPRTATIDMQIVDDSAPCLDTLVPIVPPTGTALPLTAPTLFRVATVNDDLDPYPLHAKDPIFRAPRFEWSLQAPGQPTHAVLPGATSNSFAIDPASYATGDVLELRVTIFDRNETPVACPDGDATCSTISNASCVQRQTWRVEVR